MNRINKEIILENIEIRRRECGVDVQFSSKGIHTLRRDVPVDISYKKLKNEINRDFDSVQSTNKEIKKKR